MDTRTFVFISLLVLPPVYYWLASIREGKLFQETRKRSEKMEKVDTIFVIVLIVLLFAVIAVLGVGLYVATP